MMKQMPMCVIDCIDPPKKTLGALGSKISMGMIMSIQYHQIVNYNENDDYNVSVLL